MAENDTKTDEKSTETLLKAELAALREENARTARELAEKVGQVAGQVASLATQTTQNADNTAVDEQIDINVDPQKALDQHFQKRAGPILAMQTANAVATQRELVEIKRSEDWKAYGKLVEAKIKENRISDAVLSVPGTFEQLLNLVKSERVEEIAEKKANELFEAHKAKLATAGAPSGGGTPPPGATKPDPEPTERELFILKKLGVDPKKAIEVSKATFFDGVRLTGEVAH